MNSQPSLKQKLLPYKSCIGYFLGGLTAALAFTGLCLMSCDGKIRRQEVKMTVFESDDYVTDLGLLHRVHQDVVRSLRQRKITCHEATKHFKNIHTQIAEKDELAKSGFHLAGLRWTQARYFDGQLVQPVMYLFLTSAIFGLICVAIVVINRSDRLTSTFSAALTAVTNTSSASSNQPASSAGQYRRIPIPSRNSLTSQRSQHPSSYAQPSEQEDSRPRLPPETERIPKCYKLKELESDLESITRLELDDQDAGNDYVYGPWVRAKNSEKCLTKKYESLT